MITQMQAKAFVGSRGGGGEQYFIKLFLISIYFISNMIVQPKINILGHQKFNNKFFYFILYSENQCISKLDKIGIFIDMKFH